MILKESMAETVESENPELTGVSSQELLHTIQHLLARLPGKGQRQDLVWGKLRVCRKRQGNPVGDDAGLPGARSRDDENRPLEG